MFVEEYLQELRAERFRPAAVAHYISRVWQRGLLDVAANPEAARSILLLGLLLFGLAFVGCVGLALAADLGAARRTLTWTGLWLIPLTAGLLLHVGMLRDRDGYALSGMNLPTAITSLRLALVPSLAVTLMGGYWRASFWIFLAAMATDVLDGWTARRLKQETRLGAVLDPITDIVFHLALFLSMREAGLIGRWAASLAAIRYGGMLIGGSYLYVVHGPVRINSTLPGKLSGLVIGTMVGLVLLDASYGTGPFGRVLVSLAQDGLVILLAAGIVHGATMGWHNLRYAAEAAEAARKVIRGVRFGERTGGA